MNANTSESLNLTMPRPPCSEAEGIRTTPIKPRSASLYTCGKEHLRMALTSFGVSSSVVRLSIYYSVSPSASTFGRRARHPPRYNLTVTLTPDICFSKNTSQFTHPNPPPPGHQQRHTFFSHGLSRGKWQASQVSPEPSLMSSCFPSRLCSYTLRTAQAPHRIPF